MTDRALARRVHTVEKRLGVTGRPLEQLSDLDLLGAIEAVSLALAADGNTDAKDTLAQHDAQEAALRAFWARSDMAGRNSPMLEAGVGEVDRFDLCTSCNADLFLSHRRDDGVTGRQGVIGVVVG